MLTGRVIQNTIRGIHQITGAPIALFDAFGNIVYSVGEIKNHPKAAEVAGFAEKDQVSQKGLAKVVNEGETEYIVSVGDGASEAGMIAELAAMQLTSLQSAGMENPEKENFYRNLLLGNLLSLDIHSRARELEIDEYARRAVILIGISSRDEGLTESRIEKAAPGDNVVALMDDRYLILIRQLEPEEGYEEIGNTAREAMKAVGMGVRASYGTIVDDLKDIPRSYKEALIALDIAGTFSPDKEITAYSSLGIGRLVCQLPMPLCRTFVKEVFGNRQPDFFDDETIITVNKFFENNLNVSETSRQLYIHRNTLVYRLDKIYKMTGLDLRLFEDAVTFKIAMMVVQYMKYMETIEK